MIAQKANIAGKELWECLKYKHHPSGKNWVAELTGFDARFKFERKFQEFINIDKQKYLCLEEGKIYEFNHTYYSGWGKPNPDPENGMYLLSNGSLLKKSEREVIDILSHRSGAGKEDEN